MWTLYILRSLALGAVERKGLWCLYGWCLIPDGCKDECECCEYYLFAVFLQRLKIFNFRISGCFLFLFPLLIMPLLHLSFSSSSSSSSVLFNFKSPVRKMLLQWAEEVLCLRFIICFALVIYYTSYKGWCWIYICREKGDCFEFILAMFHNVTLGRKKKDGGWYNKMVFRIPWNQPISCPKSSWHLIS